MLHTYVTKGFNTGVLYSSSKQRNREARNANLTPDFPRPRCPDCRSADLLPYTEVPAPAIVFWILATEAILD
jgi:hypothetical protein